MQPIGNKVLIRFVAKQTSKKIVIVGADGKQNEDTSTMTGDFFIEKVGPKCSDEIKVGQQVTLKEHYYKIVVVRDKDNASKGIYHMLICEDEIWGVQ